MKIAIPLGLSKTQFFINMAYVQFVKEAGFEPVCVTTQNNPEAVADMCDGLLLPGGIDIDPTYYGGENLASFGTSPEKDALERDMLHAFIAAGKPSFGICRGFQLIAREWLAMAPEDVVHPFSYSQHIPGHSLVEDREVPRTAFTHKVLASSELHVANPDDVNEQNEIFVNSMHHQALMIKEAALDHPEVGINPFDFMGAQILATSTFQVKITKKPINQRIIVEAIEVVIGEARCRGVQWHPEELTRVGERDLELLRAFFIEEEAIIEQLVEDVEDAEQEAE